MIPSTVRSVCVMGAGSVLCEAGEEILYIICLNGGLERVELYRSKVTIAIVILHACAVTLFSFPLQLTEHINYKPNLKHSCIFCNVFFEG